MIPLPNHWPYVIAAYGLATLILGGYWRRLARREREIASLTRQRRSR